MAKKRPSSVKVSVADFRKFGKNINRLDQSWVWRSETRLGNGYAEAIYWHGEDRYQILFVEDSGEIVKASII
jgi:hypothetical protein